MATPILRSILQDYLWDLSLHDLANNAFLSGWGCRIWRMLSTAETLNPSYLDASARPRHPASLL